MIRRITLVSAMRCRLDRCPVQKALIPCLRVADRPPLGSGTRDVNRQVGQRAAPPCCSPGSDDALLVISKPAGLVVHPSYKQGAGTLLNPVLAHRPNRTSEPGIITRLDKQTSGIVLIAMAPNVHRVVQ